MWTRFGNGSPNAMVCPQICRALRRNLPREKISRDRSLFPVPLFLRENHPPDVTHPVKNRVPWLRTGLVASPACCISDRIRVRSSPGNRRYQDNRRYHPGPATFGSRRKGPFVKEIEEALLRKEIDLAVHSMKDVPAFLPPGLTLAATLTREDPRDVFLSPHYPDIKSLPQKARVGTSSLRRLAQIREIRNDLEFIPLRGNVGTRIRKWKKAS